MLLSLAVLPILILEKHSHRLGSIFKKDLTSYISILYSSANYFGVVLSEDLT